MKHIPTFEKFAVNDSVTNEALNQGKTRELAHLILNKLVDTEVLKPKEKTEELLDMISSIILNYK